MIPLELGNVADGTAISYIPFVLTCKGEIQNVV